MVKRLEQPRDINNLPMSDSAPFSDTVLAYDLVANTAQEVTIPAGARFVKVACTANVYAVEDVVAAVPPVYTPGYQVVDVGGDKVGGTATGLANDATVYTADVDVDGGGDQPIAVTGSAAQTYTTLLAELNTDTTDATWALVGGNLRCTSDGEAVGSTIAITDTDLFSTLTGFVEVEAAVAPVLNNAPELNPGFRALSPDAETLSVISPSNSVVTLAFYG